MLFVALTPYTHSYTHSFIHLYTMHMCSLIQSLVLTECKLPQHMTNVNDRRQTQTHTHASRVCSHREFSRVASRRLPAYKYYGIHMQAIAVEECAVRARLRTHTQRAIVSQRQQCQKNSSKQRWYFLLLRRLFYSIYIFGIEHFKPITQASDFLDILLRLNTI